MSLFNSYNLDTVPQQSKEALQKTHDQYGQVINIFADMAESPLPIDVYSYGQDQALKRATLGPEKVNVVQLAVSVENVCEFCVPAHTWVAVSNFKTDKAVIDAIREGRNGPDASINALVNFTRLLVRQRGKMSDAQVQAFLDAGHTKEQVFEVLTIAAYKTITNYTSALAGTKPNEGMDAFAWSPQQDLKEAV